MLVAMPDMGLVQVFGHLFSTGAVICYLICCHPFKSSATNTREVLNEFIVMLAAYPLLMFTTWIYDEDVRFYVGWFFIGCMSLGALLNLNWLMISQLINCKLKAKR